MLRQHPHAQARTNEANIHTLLTFRPNRVFSETAFLFFWCGCGSRSWSSNNNAAPGSGKRGGGATHAANRAATFSGVPVRTMTRRLGPSTMLEVASFIICCRSAPKIMFKKKNQLVCCCKGKPTNLMFFLYCFVTF